MFQFTLKRLLLIMLLLSLMLGLLSWAWRTDRMQVFVILAAGLPVGVLVVVGLVQTIIGWIKEERGP